MRRAAWSAALLCALCPLTLAAEPRSTPRVVRVALPRQDSLNSLLAAGFDLATVHAVDPGGDEAAPPAADLVVSDADLARLRRLGFDPRPVTPTPARTAGIQALVSVPPGFGQGSLGGCFTFDEIVTLLDLYAAQYPQVVGPKQVLGTSAEGRPVYAVRVSAHPNVDENEPRVLLDGLHHAREPASAHCLLFLLHHLATRHGTDPELTGLLADREVWLVPVVNPDGYVHNQVLAPAGGGLWRKNRRPSGAGCIGVDLNRNYPFQWGIDDFGSSGDPCAATYRGPAPGSEPEVAALDAFVQARGFAILGSLHAHGRLLLHPQGHGAVPVKNLPHYREHGEELAAWNGYLLGAVYDVLAPANGNALDHHHAVYGVEAWTLEVGTSFWPAPAELLAVAEENLEPLLLLVRYAGSHVLVTGVDVDDAGGNQNGHADPGETVELRLRLRNRGLAATAGPLALTLASSHPHVVVLAPDGSAAPLPPFADGVTLPGGIQVAIPSGVPPGERIDLAVTITHDGRTVERTLPLDLGTPRIIARDAFETDLGWSAGVPDDTAVTGRWVRANPTGIWQGQEVAQPDDDATPAPGTLCHVTGNGGTAPGQDDVDNGRTTLLSPRFDLTATVAPRFRYRRFYWCSKADDALLVDVSADDGQNWTLLETVTGHPNAWTPVEVALPAGVLRTDRMRLRVRADDPWNTSVTEAALDDVEVVDYGSGPHLLVFGRPAPGAMFELQAATVPQGRLFVLVALAPFQAAVGGFAGTLGLDPTSLVILLDATAPADGLLRIPLPVPQNATLHGLQVWFQALALGGTSAFSNVQAVTLLPP